MVRRKEEQAWVFSRKSTGRSILSPRPLSPQKLQEIPKLAAPWGKLVARRVGPTTGLDFQAMEQVAAAAATGLTEGTRDTLLEQHAQTLGSEQPCPDCGRLCAVRFKDRPWAVPGGPLPRHEPVSPCPECRRDFFPPADRAASGQARL